MPASRRNSRVDRSCCSRTVTRSASRLRPDVRTSAGASTTPGRPAPSTVSALTRTAMALRRHQHDCRQHGAPELSEADRRRARNDVAEIAPTRQIGSSASTGRSRWEVGCVKAIECSGWAGHGAFAPVELEGTGDEGTGLDVVPATTDRAVAALLRVAARSPRGASPARPARRPRQMLRGPCSQHLPARAPW